jgi:hypothetical protein
MRRPVARPGLLRAGGPKPAPDAPSREFSRPNDSGRPLRFPYITTSRLRWLSTQLTDLDWQLLEFVGAWRLASGHQLVRRFWSTTDRESAAARAGRRALKRLADWRVLDPLPRRIGSRAHGSESTVYSVGRAGSRLLAQRGQAVRCGAPGALYVDHTITVTDLAVALQAADREGTLELVAPPDPEPACWRTFTGAGGARVTLKADLFVAVAAGPDGREADRWLVEVDRSTESSATIKRKALVHLAYWRSGSEPVHPRVLWAVPDERRVVQICEVLARLPESARRLFVVVPQDEVIDLLAREARS